MSYRYSVTDVVVGIGMCAIVLGALLLFLATTLTLQEAIPQPLSMESSAGMDFGMRWLQPALGQAIVEEAVLDRRTDQAIAQSAKEWNRATIAYHDAQSLPGPFASIMQHAIAMPAEHQARVQMVTGQAIVNFTKRAVRHGVLWGDQHFTQFNARMIQTTEANAQRMDDEFTATWQGLLGRAIVDASQQYASRTGAMQERLGTAVVQVVQAQGAFQDERATNQYQLASLLGAATRTEALMDRVTRLAAIDSTPEPTTMASTAPAAWPEMPIGLMVISALLLASAFFGGLWLAAWSRESRALAEMRHQASQWVFRMASS
jgi:hypothetical protein